jgi:hypothetical protein
VVVPKSRVLQNNSIHKRKEAPDLRGKNGRGRNSILRACSKAIFSVIPYLITLFNYGGAMRTIEILQTK